MSHESKKDNNSSIKEIPLKSWEEFETKIEEDRQECEKLEQELDNKKQRSKVSDLLFRGQRNACWALETTLERYVRERKVAKQEYSWKDYYNILERVLPVIKSRTAYRNELPAFQYPPLPLTPTPPSGHEMMIHLRHHEFPSPLLDWTRSHYIAAFFAFRNESNCPKVAIFSFREFAGQGKTSPNGPCFISTIGPYVKTHERHYLQQAEYSYCFKCFKKEDNPNERVYWSYEEAEFGTNQDILKKYIIPSKERKKVLEKLDRMNINAFSLFGNEESLMETLAYQEIENCRWQQLKG